MKPGTLIEFLAENIVRIHLSHPLRIAVDGVDASGKTYFADALSKTLKVFHREVIRASVDGFHNPESIRRQRGNLSPEGFYHDSFNYPTLITNLLVPLGPGGSLHYRTKAFNYLTDEPVVSPMQTASKDAFLLMDGIFLLRPVLLPHWDLTIFLHADFSVTVQRGAARDAALFGSKEKAEERYWARYVPGQALYFKQVNPLDKADILIDNNILKETKLLSSPF